MLKIFFDLDYTLFDTAAFKNALGDSVGDLTSPEDFDRTYRECMGTYDEGYHYTFESHAKEISRISQSSVEEIISRLRAIMSSCNAFLYPDSLTALKETKDCEAQNILLTFGDKDFQRQKLDSCSLWEYFDQVIFAQTHKHKLKLPINEKNGRDAIFINDNVNECLDLQKIYPEATYLLVAHNLRKYNGISHDFTIYENCLEAVKHLKACKLC